MKAMDFGVEIYTEQCIDETKYIIADTLSQLIYMAFHNFDPIVSE